MKIFRHVVLALLIVGPMLLSNFRQVEAAAWHSPSVEPFFTVESICRNGAEIILMRPIDNIIEASNFSPKLTLMFEAFRATEFLHIKNGPPQKVSIPLTAIGPMLGKVGIAEAAHKKPLHWNMNGGSEGNSYLYAKSIITWDEVGRGSPIFIRRNGTDFSFRGYVENCWL